MNTIDQTKQSVTGEKSIIELSKPKRKK